MIVPLLETDVEYLRIIDEARAAIRRQERALDVARHVLTAVADSGLEPYAECARVALDEHVSATAVRSAAIRERSVQ